MCWNLGYQIEHEESSKEKNYSDGGQWMDGLIDDMD